MMWIATTAYLWFTATDVPSLEDLGSKWIDPNIPVSTNLPEQLGGNQRDLAVINNFWGSVGIAPEGVRPVDLFAINSLELPPFAGCGSNAQSMPFGCGRLLVNGEQSRAASTQWQAYQAGRRGSCNATTTSGVATVVDISSATRMAFEDNAIMWVINFTARDTTAINVTFDLGSTVQQFATVGTWVYPAPNTPGKFLFKATTGASGQQGVMSTGTVSSNSERPALSHFVFVGDRQPDVVSMPQPAPSPACDISGQWVQDRSGQVFTVHMVGLHQFNLTNSAEDAKRDGWAWANGTTSPDNTTFELSYFRPSSSPGGHGFVFVKGNFFGDCQHAHVTDSPWHRPGAPPPPPSSTSVPSATFTNLHVTAGQPVTLRVALSIAANASALASTEAKVVAGFDAAFEEAHTAWERRWMQAFEPNNGFFSGHLPTLSLPPSDPRTPHVTRVYYMSILTVLAGSLRTNLPLVHPRAFVNGQGNLGWPDRGIGGSRSWWWDEGMTSLMLSLLEPDGRPPTLQAWLRHDVDDVFGHGQGNGYAMDCSPLGKGTSCSYHADTPLTPPLTPGVDQRPNNRKEGGPEYGFYCYNPWAYFLAISNHLRVNNDTEFLHSNASTSSLTVDSALAEIALDWREYLIPDTHLVDYGPAMDGFSPTYKHVMPGCSQGNNVYMLRELATLRQAQHKDKEAAQYRAMAKDLASATLRQLYTVEDGKGWFNVAFPPLHPGQPITAHEMRHVVDFFSVTFGLCGLTDQPCDFSAEVRAELGNWFREETLTSTWIRATSPRCNCSHSWPLSNQTTANAARPATPEGEFPAYPTCAAGRPDHGSDGAYPSWPAFAVEALCYLDGNCSSALDILASFADNTHEGPFGQAHQVPQMSSPPYTPFDTESAFKPIAGVTRYIAEEGGSFFEAILRGFFGYHPPMLWAPDQELEALLHLPHTPRGFSGSLRNIRTPLGLATITSNTSGLSMVLNA